MTERRELVFVYGTLRRGASDNHRLGGARFLADAGVAGRLFRVAWYPGLVPEVGAGSVMGEVFEVDREQLAELDRFEGCDPASGCGEEYRRVRRQVRLGDGRVLEVWLWEWLGEPGPAEPISSGDWLKENGLG